MHNYFSVSVFLPEHLFISVLDISDKDLVLRTEDLRNQSFYELMKITRINRRRRNVNPIISSSTPYFDIIDGKSHKQASVAGKNFH